MRNVTNMEKGIAVAGTILVDKLNEISAYPNSGELTKILSISKAVGGCVPNVSVDLKRLDPELPVRAVGLIGADEEGEFVKAELNKDGVDTTLIVTANDKTSFTDVMSVSGGQRTFFTYAGANGAFGYDNFPFDSLQVKMLHLGYFLLLDKVDDGDGIKILQKAQSLGIKTSIDLVSENSTRYQKVLPCLAYTDNLIINEVEAGNLTGIEPTLQNLRAIAEKLKEMGVKERVIIHAPEIGVCLSNNGFSYLPSFDLPKGFIQGTTGAGDAFCAGALVAIYREYSDEQLLELASLSATSALSQTDAVSGMKTEKEIRDLYKNFNRRKICL